MYELNEVPWKLIDYYTKLKPKSTLNSILKNSHQLTTMTHDEGELHPWSTWPTLHRGIYNTSHKINFINQELPQNLPPIWEILVKNNIKTGIFGSLQSFPTKSNSNYQFYIPDTFSPSFETFPKTFENFQKFNLLQTQRDGAIARSVSINKSFIKDVLQLYLNGLKTKTIITLASHILKEKFNKDHKTYRSIMQSPVAFDFFYKALVETKPQFCTFFTNHVAGMMHRYWKYSFPEDFSYSLTTKREKFLSKNIIKSMEIVDKQLKKLKAFCDRENYNLFILSSMGQEAIDRGEYFSEFRFNHLNKLYSTINYTKKITNLMAMQPNFSFEFENQADMDEFEQKINEFIDENGNNFFYIRKASLTLNITPRETKYCVENKLIFHKNGSKFPIEELGIEVIDRDQGTGYHQPKGIGILYGKKIKPNNDRKITESVRIAPTILSYFGISKEPYMAETISNLFY